MSCLFLEEFLIFFEIQFTRWSYSIFKNTLLLIIWLLFVCYNESNIVFLLSIASAEVEPPSPSLLMWQKDSIACTIAVCQFF